MDESGPVEFWPGEGEFKPPTYKKPESRDRGDKVCAIPPVSYRYANGVVVTLGKGAKAGGLFLCDEGKMEISRNRVNANPAELIKKPMKEQKVKARMADTHYPNWFECIKTRERPVADVETGHRSATVCHLVNITRWLGRPIKWDPEKEICPGDAEANALLDRPRRKGYELPEVV
jgi:hypothetical protein